MTQFRLQLKSISKRTQLLRDKEEREKRMKKDRLSNLVVEADMILLGLEIQYGKNEYTASLTEKLQQIYDMIDKDYLPK